MRHWNWLMALIEEREDGQPANYRKRGISAVAIDAGKEGKEQAA
jgi:hypothetical protein